jgi:hypothetical protein
MLCGITVDQVKNVTGIVETLKQIPSSPAIRVVFDENSTAGSYSTAVREIHPYATILGEILDSFYVKSCDLDCYKARTKDFLSLPVDIFEVGNESNGKWAGTGAMEKVVASFDIVKGAGRRSALTLYWNGPPDDGSASCWDDKNDSAFVWAAKLPERVRMGLDYVLISFYEDDCELAKPDWKQIFTQLQAMFPNSKVGFGEVGTEKTAKKAEYMKRYYSMRFPGVRFIGGWFWWYGYQDLVIGSKPLLKTFLEVSHGI